MTMTPPRPISDVVPGAATLGYIPTFEVVAPEVPEIREVPEVPERKTGRRSYDTIRPEVIRWVWKHRIALGKVNDLEGDPGVSKSTLAVEIAAHVTTGTPWPDGTPCPVGDVLIMAAEDGPGDTIRPRLDLAGADTSRVHHIDEMLTMTDDGPAWVDPTLAHIAGLHQHIRDTGAILLIVDVLMAFMPRGVDTHRDHDVRVALRPLAELADQTGCAILLIRHLNKGTGPAMYRAGGSIGITGAIRCANVVAPSPEDDGLVVFAPGKNNLAPGVTGLTYRLVNCGDHARIEWVGTSTLRADELLTHTDEAREESNALVNWLRGHLTDHGGEANAQDVMKAATAAGFGTPHKQVWKRTRKRAHVSTVKRDWNRGWVWTLDP